MPKPKREGDFGRLESTESRSEVRAGFPESMEPRIEVRIPPPPLPGPAELKGRRAVAEDEFRPVTGGDCGRASMEEGLIVLFIVYFPALGVEGRLFLKLLEESLSFLNTLGLTTDFFSLA